MSYAPTSEGLLAPIDFWLNDADVSEILLNQPGEIYVEKSGALIRHEVPSFDARTLDHLFRLIANENRLTLSVKNPLLSASLLDKSRVQLVLPPTAKHHALSIRRKVLKQFALADYQATNFYKKTTSFDLAQVGIDTLPESEKALVHLFKKKQWEAFIESAIVYKKNIVIAGGTSSGKTTYLNACLQHIPQNERIIILEDTREIEIPHPNQVQLLAAKDNQGESNVTMQDLVQCCLRLRPDRIIMGEIRGKEILDFISSASTGHEGSITSIHANNPRVAFMRMVQMYKLNNVPSMTDGDIQKELHEVVDVIVQLAKTPEGRQLKSIYYKYGHL